MDVRRARLVLHERAPAPWRRRPAATCMRSMARQPNRGRVAAAARRRRPRSSRPQYLNARGLPVLARNVRCKGGELDILCRDGAVLVVVEVRQRSAREFGGALASVTSAQAAQDHPRHALFHLQTPRRRGATPSALRRHRRARGCRTAPTVLAWVKDAFRAA